MKTSEGVEHNAVGTYRETDPPKGWCTPDSGRKKSTT